MAFIEASFRNQEIEITGPMRTADHNNIIVKDMQLRERINHSGAGGPTRAVVENNDASSGEWQEEIYNPRTASTMAPMGIRTMALQGVNIPYSYQED